MTRLTIKDILAGKVDVGSPVVIEGWIRTGATPRPGSRFFRSTTARALSRSRLWPRRRCRTIRPRSCT